jgi:hypothetical protein
VRRFTFGASVEEPKEARWKARIAEACSRAGHPGSVLNSLGGDGYLSIPYSFSLRQKVVRPIPRASAVRSLYRELSEPRPLERECHFAAPDGPPRAVSGEERGGYCPTGGCAGAPPPGSSSSIAAISTSLENDFASSFDAPMSLAM